MDLGPLVKHWCHSPYGTNRLSVIRTPGGITIVGCAICNRPLLDANQGCFCAAARYWNIWTLAFPWSTT